MIENADNKQFIIPYQAITGNNNFFTIFPVDIYIIPYQAITGNNNPALITSIALELYHTKR